MKVKPIKLYLFLKIFAIGFAILLIYSQRLMSQSPFNSTDNKLLFYHVSDNEGLNNNFVNSIIRDSSNFIWLATENGLSKYDGYSVKNYSYSDAQQTSAFGIAFKEMILDYDKNLWIGSNLGLCTYNKSTDNFKRYLNENDSSQRYYITDIDVAPDSNIIACSPSIILLFNKNTKKLNEYLYNLNLKKLQPNEFFSNAIFDPKGNLWVCTSLHFLKIEYPGNKITYYNHNCGLIHSLFIDKRSRIWVSSEVGLSELVYWKGYTRPFLGMNINAKPYFTNEIWKTIVDDNQNFWVGTNNNGLLCYNENTAQFTIYNHDKYNSLSISNNNIRDIFIDSQDLIWVATQHQGVNFAYHNAKKKFKVYKDFAEQNTNSPNSTLIVSSVLKDSDGDLWIGSDGDGLYQISNINNKISHYTNKQAKFQTISSNAILSLYEDSKKNIWIGSYNSAITVYNKHTNKWKQYYFKCNKLNCKGLHDTRSFFEDSYHRLWIGTNGHGLFRFDELTQKFISYNSNNSNLTSDYILQVYETRNNQLWIGTYGGVSIFDPDLKEKKAIVSDINDPKSLTSNWIYSILEDRKGRIWLGTSYGLNQYLPSQNKFINYKTNSNYPDCEIDGLLEDAEGHIWISSNKGILKFNPDSDKILNFHKEDGLPSNEFCHGSCFKSRNGELFFGSNAGLVSFYPKQIETKNYKPPIEITDVLVYYKSIPKNQNNSIYPERINLSYEQTTVTVIYAALNYIGNKNNKYIYKLNGYDKEWVNAENRREATYTNLDPGLYTFEVSVVDNDNNSIQSTTSIEIYIKPPFWKTLYFNIPLFLLILITTWGVISFRFKQIKLQREKLEVIVKHRTNELEITNRELFTKADDLNKSNTLLEEQRMQLEEQANRLIEANLQLNELNLMKDKIFSIIAHDLRSPFNTILGFADILASKHNDIDSGKREEYIQLLKASSQNAYKLLENLLLWSSSQIRGLNYSPQNFNLNHLVKQNIELQGESAQYKEIKISFNPDSEFWVFADFNMIDAVVRNLLSNALKFSPKSKEVSIVLQNVNDQLLFAIADNGMGMTEAEAKMLFVIGKAKVRKGTIGEPGSGLGLIICNEFITKNKGKLWVESEPLKGSTFCFTLPVSA